MHPKALTRLINQDLKDRCQVNEIPYNLKSNSFCMNMISSLTYLIKESNFKKEIICSDDILKIFNVITEKINQWILNFEYFLV